MLNTARYLTFIQIDENEIAYKILVNRITQFGTCTVTVSNLKL
jgi:hypothetical protein